MRTLRIGTRGSALALWQSRHVAGLLARTLPGLAIELIEISSLGDRVTDVPLSHVEGTGFFTASIEQALVARDVDLAVHSYKDLPVESTPGLVVAAVPQRGPVEDVLCARHQKTLATLDPGARVGTCSARRTAQIRMVRADLDLVPLRGNVPTRVARINDDLDAVVLARAGLVRLELDAAISENFATEQVLPAPAQGAMAIQCRADDRDLILRLSALNHGPTHRAVDAERAMLHALGGGCSVPVGGLAVASDAGIHLDAGVFSLNGLAPVRTRQTGAYPEEVGKRAAHDLIARGADAILAEFQKQVQSSPAALVGETAGDGQ
jgi:hydroxymethylbilane synthase